MVKNIAAKVGYRLALIAITVGLIIAYLIFSLMAGFDWPVALDFLPSVLLGVAGVYAVGFCFGSLAGILILKKKFPAALCGIISGFLIVWMGTFIGSLWLYIEEGLHEAYRYSSPAYDYLYKPVCMVTIFGFIPIILIGMWYGLTVKRRGRKAIERMESRGNNSQKQYASSS